MVLPILGGSSHSSLSGDLHTSHHFFDRSGREDPPDKTPPSYRTLYYFPSAFTMGVQQAQEVSPSYVPATVVADRAAGRNASNSADGAGVDLEQPNPSSWRARRARCHDSFCTVACSPGTWPQR